MSEWNSDNDAMGVFQEWITLLELHRHQSIAEKRKMGKKLEAYVVENNIHSLSEIGTSIPLPGKKPADFDMTLLGCMSLLALFEDDSVLLTDTTYIHLLRHISGLWGQQPKEVFDVFLLEFPETENHVFMIEVARYLTNQFLWENKRQLPALESLKNNLIQKGVELNNSKGSLRILLLKKMQQVLKKGFFEFNARIYQRFTLHALNNLYSFSQDSVVAKGAGLVLDYASLKFAFQSHSSLRFGPFRRNAKTFKEEKSWFREGTLSFFSVQSGEFPWWDFNKTLAMWKEWRSQSSIGLFSCLLKYRVPPVILYYMQKPKGSYLAKMQTGYKVSGSLSSSREVYFTSPRFMLTSGGDYQFYGGANFPIAFAHSFFRDIPWVYDVIAQSSSVFIAPTLQDTTLFLMTFKGSHWKGNNLAQYKNFIYGYAPSLEYNSKEWPHSIPQDKKAKTQLSFTWGRIDYRLLDYSSRGVYVIQGRLHGLNSWWKRKSQKYTRGTYEVLDTSWVKSLIEIKNKIQSLDKSLAMKYYYPLWSGELLALNPRYYPKNRGIKKVLDREGIKQKGKVYTGQKFSLIEVETFSPFQLKVKEKVVWETGTGMLSVRHPFGGQPLQLDYRSWWNPKR